MFTDMFKLVDVWCHCDCVIIIKGTLVDLGVLVCVVKVKCQRRKLENTECKYMVKYVDLIIEYTT